jgi:hypothetical protein
MWEEADHTVKFGVCDDLDAHEPIPFRLGRKL